jgi:hypothetical protein
LATNEASQDPRDSNRALYYCERAHSTPATADSSSPTTITRRRRSIFFARQLRGRSRGAAPAMCARERASDRASKKSSKKCKRVECN